MSANTEVRITECLPYVLDAVETTNHQRHAQESLTVSVGPCCTGLGKDAKKVAKRLDKEQKTAGSLKSPMYIDELEGKLKSLKIKQMLYKRIKKNSASLVKFLYEQKVLLVALSKELK